MLSSIFKKLGGQLRLDWFALEQRPVWAFVNVSWTFMLWYDTGNFWQTEQLLASQAGLIHGVGQFVLQYFKESSEIKKKCEF